MAASTTSTLLIHISCPSYLSYAVELINGKNVLKKDHLSCFVGGNLARGAYTHPEGINSSEAQRQLKTGKQLAYTCYQMYARNKGLSHEYVDFRKGKNDFEKGHDASYYLLRPEVHAAIKDVDKMEKDDRMESFFMAETLKYLYLYGK